MKSNKELLTSVLHTVQMGQTGIRSVRDSAIRPALQQELDEQLKEYDTIEKEALRLAENRGWELSNVNPMVRTMSSMMSQMKLMGGEKEFLRKLDELFGMHLPKKYYEANEDITEDCLIGGYVHGNEPSHHIPYLYAWTSQPWKTQYWVREVMNKMYRNHIRGLGGNDDCGQMSAWYMFSAMGFYPVDPVSAKYVFGAPQLPSITLNLPGGKTFTVVAENLSKENLYVDKIYLNGKEYKKNYITHQDIVNGGKLVFKMKP